MLVPDASDGQFNQHKNVQSDQIHLKVAERDRQLHAGLQVEASVQGKVSRVLLLEVVNLQLGSKSADPVNGITTLSICCIQQKTKLP